VTPRQYGAPPQVDAQRLGDYLEVMTKSVFQAGMSWDVVNAKWPGFQKAFDGFDAERVADYTPDDIDRLAADKDIIRNVRKIEATVQNAGFAKRIWTGAAEVGRNRVVAVVASTAALLLGLWLLVRWYRDRSIRRRAIVVRQS